MTRTEGTAAAARQLVGASRPLSWVNTAYPFAAAYLMAGGGLTAELVVGTVFFLIPYNLLMYGINDVFDYESDLRNPRKGGVEGIVLASRWHRLTLWWACLLPVPFVLALLWWGSWESAAVLVVTLVAAILVTPTLRVFLNQQAELTGVQTEIEQQREQERLEREREEEAELRRMRKLAVPKANAVPEWYALAPKKGGRSASSGTSGTV